MRVRPGTSDAYVVWETFVGRYHLPPPDLGDVRVVVDLGANIGLTMAHLAERHPAARILGVEMDSGSVALCRENVAGWGERCRVVDAAVWIDDEDAIEYSTTRGVEYGARLVAADRASNGTIETTRAVSILSLLDEAGLDRVDFLKMDIEGAERDVLRMNVAWAERVRCLNVEVHEPYSVGRCVTDLEALGFTTTVASNHWAAVTARR